MNFLHQNIETIKRLAWDYPVANAKYENGSEIQVRIEKLIVVEKQRKASVVDNVDTSAQDNINNISHHQTCRVVSSPPFRAKISFDEKKNNNNNIRDPSSVVITFVAHQQQNQQNSFKEISGIPLISFWGKDENNNNSASMMNNEKDPSSPPSFVRASFSSIPQITRSFSSVVNPEDQDAAIYSVFPHNIHSVEGFNKFQQQQLSSLSVQNNLENDTVSRTNSTSSSAASSLFFTDDSGMLHAVDESNTFVSLLTIPSETPAVALDPKSTTLEQPPAHIPLPPSFAHKSAFPTKSSFVAMLLCGLSPNFLHKKFTRPEDPTSYLTLEEIDKISIEDLVDSEKFALCEKAAKEFVKRRALNCFENDGWSIVYDFLCTCDYPASSAFFDPATDLKVMTLEDEEASKRRIEEIFSTTKTSETKDEEKEKDKKVEQPVEKENPQQQQQQLKKTHLQIRFERINYLFQLLIKADSPLRFGADEYVDAFLIPYKKSIKSQAELLKSAETKKETEGEINKNETTTTTTTSPDTPPAKKAFVYDLPQIRKEYTELVQITFQPICRFLYLLFLNTIRPTTDHTARAFAALLFHIGTADKNRASNFTTVHSSTSLTLPYRGSFITCHAARCALIRCVHPITQISPGSVWLDAANALVVSESGARSFWATQELREILFNKFIYNDVLVPPKWNNYVVHTLSEVLWKIIANHGGAQAVFIGTGKAPARIQSSVDAVVRLGTKIATDAKEEFNPDSLEKYRQELPRYFLDNLSGSSKEADRCDDDEKFLEYVKKHLASDTTFETCKYYQRQAVHDWTLFCYCVTEKDSDCRIKFGQSVPLREAFERIFPCVTSGVTAEWFAQFLTNILDATVSASKIWGTDQVHRAFVRFLKLKELRESSSGTTFSFAAIAKIVKNSEEAKKAFGTYLLRDTLVDFANELTSSKNAQWWFTVTCRVYEKSDQTMALYATEEVRAVFIRLSRLLLTDEAARWFLMALATLLNGIPADAQLKLFGKSDEVRDALVAVGKLVTDEITLEWWFSVFQKITLLNTEVLGRYCTDEARKEIDRLGFIAKNDKPKSWVKSVKDQIAKVPRAVPDPTTKNRKYTGVFEGRIFFDDALTEDEEYALVLACATSGAAVVETRTWLREKIKF